jgi:hypothetical protein
MPTCAFCGEERTLTREHVWPNWLLKRMPTPAPSLRRKRNLGTVDIFGADTLRTRDEGPERNSQLVRVVCADCNAGWMSSVEADVKLESLIDGKSHVLNASDQQLLAFWATRTTMMVEYTDDGSRVTSDAQRRFLFDNSAERLPSPERLVWLATVDDGKPGALGYWHRVAGAAQRGQLLVPGARPNLSQTTFQIGRRVLSVWGHALNRVLEYDDPPGHVRRIWPLPTLLAWPLEPPLDADTLWGEKGLNVMMQRRFTSG